MYGVHTNEKIEWFVDMYISCDVSLLANPLQNAQHQHTNKCKKKHHVVCRFHYPLPLMHETNILDTFQMNGNYPFSQQYLHTQTNKIFQPTRDLKENDDISFFEYLNSLSLNESTYILSLKNELTKSHIFLKWIPKNIKINAFSICVTHLWFANTYIQFILDPYVTTTYCTSYMTKIDKSITSKLHSLIKKCIANNINAIQEFKS